MEKLHNPSLCPHSSKVGPELEVMVNLGIRRLLSSWPCLAWHTDYSHSIQNTPFPIPGKAYTQELIVCLYSHLLYWDWIIIMQLFSKCSLNVVAPLGPLQGLHEHTISSYLFSLLQCSGTSWDTVHVLMGLPESTFRSVKGSRNVWLHGYKCLTTVCEL